MDQLIHSLFGVLSTDTYPINEPYNTEDPFDKLKHSIFIPRFKVPETQLYYGTRTQTIIILDQFGEVRYVEKSIDHENLTNDFHFTVQH